MGAEAWKWNGSIPATLKSSTLVAWAHARATSTPPEGLPKATQGGPESQSAVTSVGYGLVLG